MFPCILGKWGEKMGRLGRQSSRRPWCPTASKWASTWAQIDPYGVHCSHFQLLREAILHAKACRVCHFAVRTTLEHRLQSCGTTLQLMLWQPWNFYRFMACDVPSGSQFMGFGPKGKFRLVYLPWKNLGFLHFFLVIEANLTCTNVYLSQFKHVYDLLICFAR